MDRYRLFEEQMKKDFMDFVEEFWDSPNQVSAWGHYYFCPADGERLIYDRHNPKNHQCPNCKINYQSDLLDKTWTYFYRNDALQMATNGFALYKLTNEKLYLNGAIEIIDFYSDNYKSFKLHNKTGRSFNDGEEIEWGCGRLMPQGLNESLAFLRLLVYMNEVKLDIPETKLLEWKEKIFDTLIIDIKPQIDKIHNISCWNLSVIGAIGFLFDDQSLIEYIFNTEFNVLDQLEHGVTEDNIWFEGSIHYNYFTLEGLTYLLYFMEKYDYKKYDIKEKVCKMYIAGYLYAFENNELPNPNDGWPNINLKTYSYQYALVSNLIKDKKLSGIYCSIRESSIPRGRLPLSEPYFVNDISLDDYYFGNSILNLDEKKPIRESYCMPNSNFVMLRDKSTNVFIKYGHNGPSHAHPDKLNIEVMNNNIMYTRDLSNTGYGVELCNEWHRMSAAHNTVVIGGKNHKSTNNGNLMQFSTDKAVMQCTNVYQHDEDINGNDLKNSMNPDEYKKYISSSKIENNTLSQCNDNIVDLTRSIQLIDEGFIDEYIVNQTYENTIDYFLHLNFPLDYSNLTIVEVENIGYFSDGYQHLKDLKKLVFNDDKVEYQLPFIKSVGDLTIKLNDVDIYLAKSYSNPVTEMRDTIILRKKAKLAKFKVIWKFKERNGIN